MSNFLARVLAAAVVFVVLTGCTPTGPAGADAPAEFVPVEVDLPTYDVGQVIKPSDGDSARISGHIVVDFDDDLTLDEIDASLATAELERVGHITGFNIITARSQSVSDVSAIQAQVEDLAGVDSAIPNYLIDIDGDVAGSMQPVAGPFDPDNGIFERPGPTGITLEDTDLSVNWPHFVMDTFPAHALADAVIGSSVPGQTVLAVVDAGGFQFTKSSSGLEAESQSILASAIDRDLAPIVVDPTGIVGDSLTGESTITVGTNSVASNSLIGAFGEPTEVLHGLEVSSCAVAQGQDLIGTGRHVRLRPIRIRLDALEEGFCTEDPTETCMNNNECPPDTGRCSFGVTTTDMFAAVLAKLGERLSDDTRVINMSIGFKLNNVDNRNKVASVLTPVFERLIAGNRIVVVSAGNKEPTEERAFAILGQSREADRMAPGATGLQRGFVVVGGTKLPDFVGFPDLDPPAPALDFSPTSEGHDTGVSTGQHVHLAAPSNAVAVLSNDLAQRRLDGGTSFSAPYVAGLAAEMFAVDPTATNAEIVSIMEETADDLDVSGPDDNVGHGRINCWKAMLTLLNRNDDEMSPTWMGVRFRNNLLSDEMLEARVNECTVDDIYIRRVPDQVADGEDNARNIPSAAASLAAIAADFSFQASQLEPVGGGVGIFEVSNPSGTLSYELPARISDLLNQRPVDSRIDDFVLTIDLRTESGSLYGTVTDRGSRVEGAQVCYQGISGFVECTTTDEAGDYVAYGVQPDVNITVDASTSNDVGDSVDLRVGALKAVRQDFSLNAVDMDEEFEGNAALSGFVRDIINEGNGENPGFPGLTVELYSQETNELLGTDVTDTNGEYFVRLPSPGSYWLRVEAEGYGTAFDFISTSFDRTDFANIAMHPVNEDCVSDNETYLVDRGFTRFGQATFRADEVERGFASGFSTPDTSLICLKCNGARPMISWNTEWMEERFGYENGFVDRIRVVRARDSEVLFDLGKRISVDPPFAPPIQYGEVNQLVQPDGDMPDLVAGEEYFIVFSDSLFDRILTFTVLSTASGLCDEMPLECPSSTVRTDGMPLLNGTATDTDGKIYGVSEIFDASVNLSGLYLLPVELTVSINPDSCNGTSGCEAFSFTTVISDDSELPQVVPNALQCFDNPDDESFFNRFNLKVEAVDACGAESVSTALQGSYSCCRNQGQFGCPE